MANVLIVGAKPKVSSRQINCSDRAKVPRHQSHYFHQGAISHCKGWWTFSLNSVYFHWRKYTVNNHVTETHEVIFDYFMAYRYMQIFWPLLKELNGACALKGKMYLTYNPRMISAYKHRNYLHCITISHSITLQSWEYIIYTQHTQWHTQRYTINNRSIK